MRFAMGAALEPHDDSAWTLAAESYQGSVSFVVDAVNWVADTNTLPGDLVDRILAAYAESSEYCTIIEDALEGEVRW